MRAHRLTFVLAAAAGLLAAHCTDEIAPSTAWTLPEATAPEIGTEVADLEPSPPRADSPDMGEALPEPAPVVVPPVDMAPEMAQDDMASVPEMPPEGCMPRRTETQLQRGQPSQVEITTEDPETGERRLAFDFEADGSLDRFEAWTYNDAGDPTSYRVDNGADGLDELIMLWEYDAEGLVTRHLRRMPDGSEREIRTYEHDADGRLVRERYDQDNDGALEHISLYVYDARGNLLSEQLDQGADGVIDWRRDHGYDASDRPLRTTVDRDGDGQADSITTMRYDDSARSTITQYDEDADGRPDRIIVNTRDAQGRVIVSEDDSDADGQPDRIVRQSFDDAGRLLSTTNEDVRAQSSWTMAWIYDNEGNLLRQETINQQGGRTVVATYAYDCAEEARPR